jgi:Protein of unknown function (DUF1403)
LAVGEGSAIAAAAAVAAVSLQKRPDAEAVALWLADAVLAHRLKWPAPVPLIAGQIRRSDLRAAVRPDGVGAWQTSWMLAYARAAAAAADLYAELTRRARHLLAAAPQLRARDAARMIEILLTEDAQAATAGASATDRSSRRLFDRLVAIGAARAHRPNHFPPLRALTMGRRARPENLDADLDAMAPELRWRAWTARVEAVIFAAKDPVAREVLARVVGPDCNLDLVIEDIRAELSGRPYDLVAVAPAAAICAPASSSPTRWRLSTRSPPVEKLAGC